MNKTRIGVLGVGNMGMSHAKRILKGNVPHMELAAVADTDPARLAACSENLPGVPQFTTCE